VRLDTDRFNLRRLLAAAEAAPPVVAVDVLAAELARVLEATEVSLLITNFSGSAVVRMSHVVAPAFLRDGENERVESLPLRGSPYEEVLFSQQLLVQPVGAGEWLVLVPVTERGDAIGLLELSLSRQPDRAIVDYLTAAAHALAYVLVASRRHTDLFEWAQRDVPFSLSAEIQRRLLPSSYTIEGGPFTIAGWLEPAATAGGDTFDYNIDREFLYVSITDAMGHMTKAALLATLTVGSLRNTRRTISSPTGQANAANRALLEAADPDQFVTGQVLRLRLEDGDLEIVNAGHPRPYLLRDGSASALTLTAGLPFGIASEEYRSEHIQLEPGDRLLLVTDGFLERNAQTLSITEALEASSDHHPREVVRELALRVLAATGGNLRDDATALCLDWFGGDGPRQATGGASRSRATAR
jgi:serine phosphatase RsbU (regulator of sigma subunit)